MSGYKNQTPASAATGIDPKMRLRRRTRLSQHCRPLTMENPKGLADSSAGSSKFFQSVYLAQYGLGSALAQLEQCPKAIEPLRKAIELQPDSAWAHFPNGCMPCKTGDYKTAAVHLEIATSRLPEFGEAHTCWRNLTTILDERRTLKRARAKAAQLGRRRKFLFG